MSRDLIPVVGICVGVSLFGLLPAIVVFVVLSTVGNAEQTRLGLPGGAHGIASVFVGMYVFMLGGIVGAVLGALWATGFRKRKDREASRAPLRDDQENQDSNRQRFNAGYVSCALAACMLFVQVLMFLLCLSPSARLPPSELTVEPMIGLASCFATIVVPLPVALGLVSLFRERRQRLWGLFGCTLTAVSLLVGFLSQVVPKWLQ